MDVFQEPNFAVLASNLEQINKVDQNESHNQDSSLKLDSPGTPPKANLPKGGPESERTSLSPSSPLSPTETPESSTTTADDSSSTHTISLTSSCSTKLVSHWALPEDCSDKAAFTMMETGSVSALSGGDCLMPQSRTCLGCFIESKDATEPEPGLGLGLGRDYDPCPVSCPDMAMQCMSSGIRYGDQLLSDQLLSYPEHKVRAVEKTDEEKSAEDSDSEDATSKSIYEGLLLDKCNGEEALLANSSQDWGCFESFISESKIELLDLCSKNELSVNLFSEEDVDNYMFDDEDSTLGSDVCSLKIRYESFQDNVREKTNTIQEETQFNFFPSVVAKKEGEGAVKKEAEVPQVNGEKVEVWAAGEKVDKNNSSSSAEVMPSVSPESSYLFDFNNSTEDSGEYSDDSSCTGSSLDTCQTKRKYCFLSRENSSSSSQLSYGLRSKRKVRYSDDYLYDVDSIESEKNTEKKEKQPMGPKKEEDDDWCPKKRRKSSRKEPPVIIKYIIINRFKGEKHMLVKLGKIDTSETTVSLSKDLVHKYQRMAPLKDYWQKRRQEMQEQRRLAAGDKNTFPNGCRRSLNSSLTKRKYRIANRVRIQRIHNVELSPNHADHKQEVRAAEDQAACTDMASITTTTSDCAARLDQGSVTGKSRSLEREGKRLGNKILKIRKFKSEARLKSKKMTEAQQEDGKTVVPLQEVGPLSPSQHPDIVYSKAGSPQLCDDLTVSVDPTEKSTFKPAPCSSSSTMTHPVNVNSGLPVIPGGYLQTLLDASDSSSNTGLSYYSQQQQQQNPRQQFPHGLYQEENPFTNLQLAQSCVLSPPSESELQQSPSNSNQMEPNFTHISWQSGGEQLPFTSDIPPESAGFSNTMPLPMTNNLPMSGYSQVNVDGNRLLNDKAHLPEEPPGPDSTLQASRSAEEEQVQFHRVTLNTENSRLASYDSMGSLSASSSNYSTMSHKSCEKESEEDVNENFLAHCSPKLVIQQSTDEITPLRESTDLLDISNFTPDKFRHSSLSEMSPPDTPNLSPQVMGPEMRESLGKAREFQGETGDMTLSTTPDGTKWDCNVLPQQNHDGRAINNHQFQFHTFNDNDGTGLGDKIDGTDVFDEQAESIGGRTKGPKSKRKTTSKQKTKTPRAPKTEKNKAPRQNSRSSKKLKALLDAKAKAKGEESEGLAGLSEDWPLLVEHGGGWVDGGNNNNSAVDDDQREFEEPSNILSNIVSGMAEVERFMKVSIEPLWDPMSGLCQPPEANSLKTKTLKILAGTTADVRKKGGYATSPGAGRGRKATGRGAKNQSKLIPSNPFFPPLTLDCNMFNKSSLGIPGICGPAHKKMYRHKTSAKFAGDENNTGKRDSSKNVALMASYEKLSGTDCPSLTLSKFSLWLSTNV
ncbi:neurite extension and migration factor-like [Oncorhynchus masou masou]|uniref:neurite extension and migration factor-like n=1 Tax=Oncorhynchus masou masou TaxID=90313 RepID=UPI003183A90B